MRKVLGVLLALACGCGGTAPQQQQGGSGGGGAVVHTLAVALTGSGLVTSSPAGIDCDAGGSQGRGVACSASFAQGTTVSLSAAAASGFTFAGWGGACSGRSACAVTLGADASVTASFTALPPPPPQSYTITVTTAGSGSVTSNPAGLDCGKNCTAKFAAGTLVYLTETAAAGWKFSGWTGACVSTQAQICVINADANVTATFEQLPPPPLLRTLTVSVIGQGTVTSSPAGISCAPTCNSRWPDGTQVRLTPTAAPGWQFAGWTAKCDPLPSGSQDCSVTLSSDENAAATFTQLPADECAGLRPSSVPAPILARLPQNSCLDGTSDDGAGTFALGYTAGSQTTFPTYLFFTIQNGQAVQIGDRVLGGDESATYLYSQPSGFTVFHRGGTTGSSYLSAYGHDGRLGYAQRLTDGSFDHYPSSAVGVDPSGGTASLRTYSDPAQGWISVYRRVNSLGAPETGEVLVSTGQHTVGAIGVALSGHALAILDITLPDQARTWGARWLDRGGAPVSDWFVFQGNGFPVARFLMDGSLAVGFTRGGQGVSYQDVAWRYLMRDSRPAVDTLPDWLLLRPTDVWWVVRNGRGYVAFGPTTKVRCGGADMGELVAASGKACGCMAMPHAGTGASVGRDGSLIVPEPPVNFGTCTFDLYPQLLQ